MEFKSRLGTCLGKHGIIAVLKIAAMIFTVNLLKRQAPRPTRVSGNFSASITRLLS